MRGVRRLLLAAGLGALVLGVALVVALPRLLARELEPARASARLSAALGMDVTVEAVELAWLPNPHVEASGVAVEGGARATAIEVVLDWRTILERRLAPTSIRLVEPVIPVIRDGEGVRLAVGAGSGVGGAGGAFPPALRSLEIEDGRIALHDGSVDPPLDTLLRVEQLEARRSWSGDAIRFEARFGLGDAGDGGRATVEGELASGRLRARIEARAVDVAALRGHLPATWDVRAASGMLDATADIDGTRDSLRADLELAMPAAALDYRGLEVGGASRLRGTLRREPGAGLRIEGGTASFATLRADRYRATGLEASFDYAEGALDVHTLRLATVTPGLGAAALELPGADAVPVELRVLEAGELTLGGRLQLPGPGETGRQLSLPRLRARGTHLALVQDAPRGRTSTEIRLDRLDWSHHVSGDTGTLKIDGAILGDTPGRVRGSARIGPLVAGRPLREHPFRAELELEDAPAAAFEPFVPASWPTPRGDLGQLDVHVDAHGEGGDLTVRFDVLSRLGDGEAEVRGTLRRRPDPAPGSWPLDLEMTLRDLDLALLEGGLGQAGLVDAAGTLDATASLVARPGGELEGTLRAALGDGRLDFDALALGGAIQLVGSLARREGTLGLVGATLDAERVTIRGFEGSDLHARGELAPPRLRIDEALASFFEGTVRADGSVSLDRPTDVDGRVEVHALNLARTLGHVPDGAGGAEPTRVDGTLSLAGRLGEEGPNWIAPLRGEGVIELRGGEIDGMPILRAVAQGLLALIPGSGLILQGRTPPTAELREAQLPYRLEGGVIRVDGMHLVSSDYTVRAKGHLDHEFVYHLDGDAALTSEGLADTLAWLAAPRAMQRTIRLPAFPIRIRGRLGSGEDASVGVDLSAVPMATARGLLGLGGRLGSKLPNPLRLDRDGDPPQPALP